MCGEMGTTLRDLRAAAVRRSLFRPTTLAKAVAQLGFIQADPIRAPARAQDLILRQRVRGYRVDDLERSFATLEIDEEYLYAYGFLARAYAPLLHPRRTLRLTALDRHVLEHVTTSGQVHPREVEQRLQRGRAINAWGGYSNATTRSLSRLARYGLLRVTARERGVRLYELRAPHVDALPIAERMRGIAMLLARIFAPAPVPSLRAALAIAARFLPKGPASGAVVTALVRSGELEAATVDGIPYAWPAESPPPHADDDVVRLLAPFDPVVWDRKRFEHLWGWPYRFEAYTPVAKRKLGYYALPLLWRHDVIGWANVSASADALDVQTGFVGGTPRERAFRVAFDAEVERLSAFFRLSKP
jgi:uncharacterized protein YcaQ